MQSDLMTIELKKSQFETISSMMYDLCGINLGSGKEDLVRARLTKRLRMLGLGGFDEYLNYLQADQTGKELTTMIDSLTTNKTSFFREAQHFDFLKERVLPNLVRRGDHIRFWSAGCSSGEEPYTLGILFREEIPDIDRKDVRILATDISTRVLTKAANAVYDGDTLSEVSPQLIKKHFTSIESEGEHKYRVKDNIKNMISFARLNLMDPWPMKGPFNAIFCRNVMIYFDKPTQQALVHRFWQLLEVGGYLFVGHSESLASSSHEFRYVQPAVYVKYKE